MRTLCFLEDFALGAASSGLQVEGIRSDNNWQDWAQKGNIRDGSDPSRAVDHARFFKEDAQLMHEMGIRHCRMGVEWARIQPREDCFDEEALAAYYREIIYLKGLGIRPLVTLHHFTNPMWFEKKGGFDNPDCVRLFCAYVERVVRYFGAAVEEYLTINEPNVYALNGYLTGQWPPGRRSLFAARRVLNRLRDCHIAAYETIHRVRGEMKLEGTRVSYAHHMSAFYPKNPNNPLHRACASWARQAFQTGLAESFLTGQKSFPFHAGKQGFYCDFHALNYYAASTIGAFCRPRMHGAPVNDLGWQIDPKGIVECAKDLFRLAPLPLYITENGVCDRMDTFRARYILEHLLALEESGLPVKRYYHWCFTDNFEWLEGMSAPFGLVRVDRETGARTLKQSGEFYAQMIRRHGADQDLIRRYCTGEYPKMD